MSAPTTNRTQQISGVLLAGGRATRMGGTDKGLLMLAGRPMAAHVAERLRPQVDELIINANRNADAYAAYADRVVADTMTGYLGPLAGLLAGMSVAGGDWLVTVPCDSPFVPHDLVARMVRAQQADSADLAVAYDGERRQPVFMLVAAALQGDLQSWLADGGRKIDAWFARHRVADVDCSDCPDTFLNINTPEERAAIEARLQDDSE